MGISTAIRFCVIRLAGRCTSAIPDDEVKWRLIA